MEISKFGFAKSYKGSTVSKLFVCISISELPTSSRAGRVRVVRKARKNSLIQNPTNFPSQISSRRIARVDDGDRVDEELSLKQQQQQQTLSADTGPRRVSRLRERVVVQRVAANVDNLTQDFPHSQSSLQQQEQRKHRSLRKQLQSVKSKITTIAIKNNNNNNNNKRARAYCVRSALVTLHE